MSPAVLFGRKTFFKLLDSPRRIIHAWDLQVVAGRVKGRPTSTDMKEWARRRGFAAPRHRQALKGFQRRVRGRSESFRPPGRKGLKCSRYAPAQPPSVRYSGSPRS